MSYAREKAVERLADLFDAWHDAGRRGEAMLVARGNMVRDAEALLAEIGAVFVDPALAEAARTKSAAIVTMRRMHAQGPISIGMPRVTHAQLVAAERDERDTRLALADAVVAQLEPKP